MQHNSGSISGVWREGAAAFRGYFPKKSCSKLEICFPFDLSLAFVNIKMSPKTAIQSLSTVCPRRHGSFHIDFLDIKVSPKSANTIAEYCISKKT